jgi:hypothetical protein
MFRVDPSEPKGACQLKHTGIPSTKKPKAAAFSVHFEDTTPVFGVPGFRLTGTEPGGSVDGGESDTGTAEPKATLANLFPSTGSGGGGRGRGRGRGGGAASKPSLFAATCTAAPCKPSLIFSGTEVFSVCSFAEHCSLNSSTEVFYAECVPQHYRRRIRYRIDWRDVRHLYGCINAQWAWWYSVRG